MRSANYAPSTGILLRRMVQKGVMSSLRGRSLLLASLLAVTPAVSGASWTLQSAIGPYCGIQHMMADPERPGILYAATANGCGIKMSVDSGATWRSISGGWGYAVAIQPSGGRAVLAGSSYGGCRSTDAGETWTCDNAFGDVRSIAFSQNNPLVVYRIRNGIVQKSTNAGETWQSMHASALPASWLAVHPTDIHTIYARASAGRVMKSVNGGATWTTIYQDTFSTDTWCCARVAVNPHKPLEVWATTTNGVVRSRDTGQTWATVIGNPDGGGGTSPNVAFDATLPGRVLVGLPSSGIRVSLDGGDSWSAMQPHLGFVGRSALEVVGWGLPTLIAEYNSERTAYIALPRPATACSGFEDVGEGSSFCDSVEWLRNRAVTLGCGPAAYCPDSAVSRIQMAAFMSRLGIAILPRDHSYREVAGAVDVASGGRICVSDEISIADFPATSTAHAAVVFQAPTGSGVVGARLEISTDSGATWQPVVSGVDSRLTPPVTVGARSTLPLQELDRALHVGQRYRFAVLAWRVAGSIVSVDADCLLTVRTQSRRSTLSPY